MNTKACKLTLCLAILLMVAPNLFAVTLTDYAGSGETIFEAYTFDDMPSTASATATIYANAPFGGIATGTILWVVPGIPGLSYAIDITASGSSTNYDSVSNQSIPLGTCIVIHIGSVDYYGSNVSLTTNLTW